MIDIKAGDKVRCINDDPHMYDDMLPKDIAFTYDMNGLKAGEIYTVSEVELCHVGRGIQNRELDLMGVYIEGIYRAVPFGITRFEVVKEE